MDQGFVALVFAVFVLIGVQYYRENKKNKELERELGEALLREHQRKNIQEVSEHLAGRSDSDIFNEAISRGLDKSVPKPSGNEGDQ